jgi:hypothetical protein
MKRRRIMTTRGDITAAICQSQSDSFQPTHLPRPRAGGRGEEVGLHIEIRAVAKAPAAIYSTTGSAFLEMWAGQGSRSANFDRCAGQDSIARLPNPSGAASICRLARLQNTSSNDLKTLDNQITFLWHLMRISDIFAS